MNNIQAFFELLRAGLWEKEALLSQYNDIDYSAIMKLAEEQSVVGIVAAGLEHVIDTKVPKEEALQFAGNAMQMEQRNTAMNSFIEVIVDKLRESDINALLVKGQGIAQCYERPLWRACGDVDLFLNSDDYDKSIELLKPFAVNVEENRLRTKHIGMTIEKWEVELHGTLRCRVGKRIDNFIDKLQEEEFHNGAFRIWENGNTQVLLPNVNGDVFFVFTHILQHLFRGGIGLRQVCDWCRLLWFHNDSIDVVLLKKRIQDAGITTEWKVFAALAVEWLGMPIEVIPLYSAEKRWSNKAKYILSFIMETGNFGHNRDMSYLKGENIFVRKIISFWRDSIDCLRLFAVFPKDAIRVWFILLGEGIGKISLRHT